jgi:hypothetical protein
MVAPAQSPNPGPSTSGPIDSAAGRGSTGGVLSRILNIASQAFQRRAIYLGTITMVNGVATPTAPNAKAVGKLAVSALKVLNGGTGTLQLGINFQGVVTGGSFKPDGTASATDQSTYDVWALPAA